MFTHPSASSTKIEDVSITQWESIGFLPLLQHHPTNQHREYGLCLIWGLSSPFTTQGRISVQTKYAEAFSPVGCQEELKQAACRICSGIVKYRGCLSSTGPEHGVSAWS